MAGHSGLTDTPLSAAPDLVQVFGLWTLYLSHEKHFSRHTLRAYLADVHYFCDFLTTHLARPPSLHDLGDASIRDFRSWLAKRTGEGAGAATRARALASLRNFMKWLDKNGHLHNPAIGRIRTPKLPRKLPRALPPDQAMKLMDNAGMLAPEGAEWVALRDCALFMLLYGCGLRIDEALQLDFGARPKDGEVRVMGKGRKERIVPVLPIVEKTIETYVAGAPIAWEKKTPLFMGERGKRMHQGVAQKRLRDLRRVLGLPEALTPHALRHSFATHILAGGVNLRVIQELLGHASVTTTQRYTDYDNAQLLAIYDKAHPRARSE
ncbi:MAG: tyrosine recombinase XerC [Alphaproteobacteria bacterium]|nr:tyrosine recombinase XerC [Alphaproteobacteria bacterium]